MTARNPAHRALINRLLIAERNVTKTNMRVEEYHEAQRLLRGGASEVVGPATYDSRKVAKAFRRLGHAVGAIDESRLLRAAETVLYELTTTGNRQAAESTVAFALCCFDPFHEPDIRHELTVVLPHWQIAGTEKCRLLLAPAWFHGCLAARWKNSAAWQNAVRANPSYAPLNGISKAVSVAEEESEGLRALWEDDPRSLFFNPRNAIDTVRLL